LREKDIISPKKRRNKKEMQRWRREECERGKERNYIANRQSQVKIRLEGLCKDKIFKVMAPPLNRNSTSLCAT
jgi:hypothetical protein